MSLPPLLFWLLLSLLLLLLLLLWLFLLLLVLLLLPTFLLLSRRCKIAQGRSSAEACGALLLPRLDVCVCLQDVVGGAANTSTDNNATSHYSTSKHPPILMRKTVELQKSERYTTFRTCRHFERSSIPLNPQATL